jgi:hypothetical protein
MNVCKTRGPLPPAKFLGTEINFPCWNVCFRYSFSPAWQHLSWPPPSRRTLFPLSSKTAKSMETARIRTGQCNAYTAFVFAMPKMASLKDNEVSKVLTVSPPFRRTFLSQCERRVVESSVHMLTLLQVFGLQRGVTVCVATCYAVSRSVSRLVAVCVFRDFITGRNITCVESPNYFLKSRKTHVSKWGMLAPSGMRYKRPARSASGEMSSGESVC